MSNVCQGKIEQLGWLFERYHKKLFNFYLRTTANRELSEDLTQMVFERILKYKHSYKEGASFKTWFYSIARNVKIDYFRKNKIPTTDIENLNWDRNFGHRDLETEIERNEKIKMLYEALNTLNDEKRELVILTQIEGMEYSQIAHIFNITENAARVKVHRTLKELKEIFQKK
ncbi:MAG: RNA polymerase sigma factor [Cytophagales bacterium]|nr:MAG: RNA polymerase sigma factor [Cytophagales bacterium]